MTMSERGRSADKTGRARPHRIMIVAGEASGDMHGADLVREIRSRDPDCELFGIGGERMAQAGVRTLCRAEDIAGLGLIELASTIGRTLAALRSLRTALRRQQPDLLILIDFAEFNMALARSAKHSGVPVLYYITPQVWAWRRGRIRKLVERADRLAVVLPFEAELFPAAGDRVVFVGHPLLDKIGVRVERGEILRRYGIAPEARLLAVLPGSRPKELRYLLPPMLQAARILARQHALVPCLALAHTLSPQLVENLAGTEMAGVHVIRDDTYSIVAASEVALVASGTATLEVALLGCPMVIAYKVASLTYHLARLLVTGVDHIGMPNILARARIVPELIQGEVSGARLAEEAARLLREPERGRAIAALRAIRELLGAPGAAGRVAAMALEMMA